MFRIFDAANLLCEDLMAENQNLKNLLQQY